MPTAIQELLAEHLQIKELLPQTPIDFTPIPVDSPCELPWENELYELTQKYDSQGFFYVGYKPVIHFSEHINRLIHTQAITYPPFLLSWIRFHVHSSLHHSEIYFIIKKKLKDFGLSKYNEHIHYFITLLTGKHLRIPYHVLRAMKELFLQLYHGLRHQKWLPRKHNCLSYYCIVQFFFYLFQITPLYRLPTILNPHQRYRIYETLYLCYLETQFHHCFHRDLPKRTMLPFLDKELSYVL